MATKAKTGWAWPEGTRKAHFFSGGRSLCCRWGYFGDRFDIGDGEGYSKCAVCRKRKKKADAAAEKQGTVGLSIAEGRA